MVVRGLKPQQHTLLASFSAPSRTQMYCLHPQALKVRNPLRAKAHAELSGVDRGCIADESATTTHRRLILAALCSCLSEIRISSSLMTLWKVKLREALI